MANEEDGVGTENESVAHGEVRERAYKRAGNNVHYGSMRASLASDCWKQARGDVDSGT